MRDSAPTKTQEAEDGIAEKNPNVCLDISSVETPSNELGETIQRRFGTLSKQANWSSARDVGTVAGKVFNRALESRDQASQGQLLVSGENVEAELDTMIAERGSRSAAVNPSKL